MSVRTTNNRPTGTTSGRGSAYGAPGDLGRRGGAVGVQSSYPLGNPAYNTNNGLFGPAGNASVESTGDPLLDEQLAGLSGLQRLTDSLGLTNFRGQTIANYRTAMDERNYNSIQEVVKREQAAGLNPDLLGAQGAEDDQAGNMIGAMQAQGSGAFLQSFGEGVLSFVQTGLSIAQGVLSFETLGLNQDLAVLGSSSGSSLGSEVIDTLAGDFLSRKDSDLSAIQTVDELRALSDGFVDEVVKSGDIDFFKGIVKNQRLRKRLNEQMLRKLRSASGKREFYDALTSGYKSHYNARLQQAISSAAEGQVVEDDQGQIYDVFDGLANVMMKSEYYQALNNLKYLKTFDSEAEATAENAQNAYTGEYYQNMNPETAATADNATNTARNEQAKWAASLDQMRNDMLKFIDGEIAKCDTSTKEGKRMKIFLISLKYVAPTFFGGSMLQMPNMPFSVKQDKSTHNTYNQNQNTSNIKTINSVHN